MAVNSIPELVGMGRADTTHSGGGAEGTILHLLKFHIHIDRGESDPDKVTVRNIEKATLHLRFSQDMKLGVSQLKFAKADANELRRAGVSHAEKRE